MNVIQHTHISKIHMLAGLTVFVAMIMTVLPVPAWAVPFWPEWTILVVVYWCLASPQDYNLGFAWGVGLVMDLIKGTLLGQYALAYLLVAYICIHTHRRLRTYPLLQQAFLIGMLLLPYFTLCLWIDRAHYSISTDWRYFAPITTSVLLWPWIFSTLRLARHRASK